MDLFTSRAVEVEYAEGCGRMEKALGSVASIVDVSNGSHELLDFECHMPIYKKSGEVGA
jgi:hypothetical protein